MSALRSASLVRPVWEYRGRSVEGADEDEFTLLVRAGELLLESAGPGARRPPRRLMTVTELDEGAHKALADAWGLPTLDTVTFPPTELGAYQALTQALDEDAVPGEGAVWVLAARTASPRPGATSGSEPPAHDAAAVALAFEGTSGVVSARKTGGHIGADGPGLAVERAFARWWPAPTVPWRAVWATGFRYPEGTIPWERIAGLPPGGPQPPLPDLAFEDDSPLGPLVALAIAARDTPIGGAAPSLWFHATSQIVAVRELARTGPTTVATGGPAPAKPLSITDETWEARRDPPLNAVSEGAYLPKARYLESLPARWRLEGDRCGACGRWTLPPREVCRFCGKSSHLTRDRLPRSGAILEAVTVIRKGAQPTEFDYHESTHGSYAVAVARFPPGPRLTFQVTDVDPTQVVPGQVIETVLRRLYPQEGTWRYGLKARVRADIEPTGELVPPRAEEPVLVEDDEPAPTHAKGSGGHRAPAKGGPSRPSGSRRT